MIEDRIKRFSELHANKWFHTMNWTLEVIKLSNNKDKFMIIKYGKDFFSP